MEELNEMLDAYEEAFGNPPPQPFGVSDKQLIRVIREHLEEAKPIPADYDWYEGLPPDAVV